MGYSKAFGEVIRRLRKDRGWTQEQLGFEADIRRTFVSELEIGNQQPSITTIFKIAKALKIKPSELIELVESVLSTPN